MLANSPEARDAACHLHSYTNPQQLEQDGPLVIVSGQGVCVTDNHGKTYLDGMAGLWSASLGFAEPRLAEAAYRQMQRLSFYHTFFGRAPEPVIDLAEKLVQLTPEQLTRVIFANSGSEANDTAIKLIWYYNNALQRPEKKKILSRRMGYHGVTVATASLTAIPINQTAFDLPIDRIGHLSCPHHYREGREGESEEAFSDRLAEELEQRILAEGPETVAALFAEPLMAAGGVILPPKGYFEKIQEILQRHDVLLVADEVVCGFGRTGNLFGSDTYGLKPDFMTLAKALSASAAPISALLMTDDIYEAIRDQAAAIGMLGHGYTYSGHPVPAAVALETLKIYEERDILGHVRQVMPLFQSRLAALDDHPLVGEARGIGLIGAVEMVADKATRRAFDPVMGVGARANAIALQKGLILRARGDALTICPPLIITEEEIETLFATLRNALDELAKELGRV